MESQANLRVIVACTSVLMLTCIGDADAANAGGAKPRFSKAVAMDVSRPVREIAPPKVSKTTDGVRDVRPDRGPTAIDTGSAGDGALDAASRSAITAAIGAPLLSFEGLSNNDNFALYGGRVNPPDPVGDVGPNHYVEMVNLAFAVYDKQGNLLTGPTRLGDLWAGFAVADCTDPSGDPIVVYDQLKDRWLLSQFTTRGPEFFNCVAISQSGDPTGA